MLILIISILALIVGAVFIYCSIKARRMRTQDELELTGVIFSVIGSIGTIICIVMIIISHINVEHQFQQDYIEYEILQEQIDSGNYNSITITSDIISYNQKVMNNRTYYNSPWIGLFYYKNCEKLPLLEIKDKNGQPQ